MAESTVSGPFRSENGFQQLDENGEWVPVTGGGGGGVTSIIAGSGISVSSPTGAVTISATGGGGGDTVIVYDATTTTIALNFTEVGQIITVTGSYYEDPMTFTPREMLLDVPLIPGLDGWSLDGAFFQIGGMGYEVGGIGTSFPIMLQAVNTLLQFSFVGISVVSDPGGNVVIGSVIVTGVGKFS